MSYFSDGGVISRKIKINGKAMPEPSKPVSVTFQNISEGGRLADSIDYQGSLKGVKVTIELNYEILNKEHYDMLFNETELKYINNGPFFMRIEVPTYTPLGVKEFSGYFESEHCPNCTDTTEHMDLDESYWYGGRNYDEEHTNVKFKFIQK